MEISKTRVLTATLFLLAFLERTLFDLGPNVEFVTLAIVLSSFYLKPKNSFLLIFAVIVVSDLVIGNTSIFIFTWSAFLISAVLSSKLVQNKHFGYLKTIFVGTGLGIASNLFFYAWTNFGVWLMDSWGMYSNDFSGLMMSYVNGLPFLKYNLMSTILFVPLGVIVVESIISYASYIRRRVLLVHRSHI